MICIIDANNTQHDAKFMTSHKNIHDEKYDTRLTNVFNCIMLHNARLAQIVNAHCELHETNTTKKGWKTCAPHCVDFCIVKFDFFT